MPQINLIRENRKRNTTKILDSPVTELKMAGKHMCEMILAKGFLKVTVVNDAEKLNDVRQKKKKCQRDICKFSHQGKRRGGKKGGGVLDGNDFF